MSREPTIAIDGPGSAGKGTVARGVARELGYRPRRSFRDSVADLVAAYRAQGR